MVRKSVGEEDSTFKEISGAGLKKAKKGFEAAKKKAEKEEERKKKNARAAFAKTEEELRRLEEAKSIILTRNPSLEIA